MINRGINKINGAKNYDRDVEVGLTSAGQLDDVMYLVTRLFERNIDNVNH